MRAVERRSGMRGDVEHGDDRAALRIEGVQPVAGGKPDVLPIEGDASHLIHVRKGAIFAKDFGLYVLHGITLSARQRR